MTFWTSVPLSLEVLGLNPVGSPAVKVTVPPSRTPVGWPALLAVRLGLGR